MEVNETPPFEGGTGVLEVIDMMCTATEAMSRIIRMQAEALAQLEIDAEIADGLKAEREEVDKQMDMVEYRLRRL